MLTVESRTLERLLLKSELRPGPLDTPCLIWTGYVNDAGYGVTTHGSRRLERVHRVAWIERHGPIPDETPCVLHRCDVRACWADDHLFLGTKADNTADMMGKGRHVNPHVVKTHCPRGHEYTAANLVHRRGRHRTCKTCHRERQAARRRGERYL